MKRIELTGKTFGNWYVISYSGKTSNNAALWLCRCSCGAEKVVVGKTLREGKSTQCRSCATRNALTKPYRGDRIVHVFSGMKQRCSNQNNKEYKNYGGRGITVCNEWLKSPQAFYAWAYSNSFADGMSIDRIDNDQGYSPLNCRIVELSSQAKNRRTNYSITIDGETKCLSEWCRLHGIDRHAPVKLSKNSGITVADALVRCIQKR